MATENKDFKVKNGLQVGGPTNLVNVSSSSPSNPFTGQFWILNQSLYAWTGSAWALVGDGTSAPGGEFLTDAAAASAYFRISSSVSNFGTIKTIPATQTLEADLIKDELTIKAENGVILNATASADQLVISTNATWNNTASAIVMRDGEQSFDITRIDFNTDLEPGFLEPGQLEWNVEEGTLDLGMSGSVVQSIGMEFYMPPVKNQSGEEIPAGSFVMATGAQGDRITIAKAVTDGSVDPQYMIGVAAQDIPNDSEYGLITVNGIVRDINTASYAVGTILYPDPNIPGGLTSTPPTAPAIKTSIAIVLRQDANTGRIYVRMDNGSVLGGTDSNVQFTSLADNHIITYNQSASYWTNQGLAAAIQEVDGAGSGIDADLLDGQQGSYYAPINSPNFTGTPTAPTPASATNNTQIATTAFVRTEISNLVDSAPETLDTLNELAAALGDDPNFAASTASAIGQRLLASTASTLYLGINNTALHAQTASSINGSLVTGTVSRATHANTASAIAGSLVSGTVANAQTASSINWAGVSEKPSPIVGVNLQGQVTGAASATLTELNNGQITIQTSASSFGNANVYMSASAPGNPDDGDIWINTASSVTPIDLNAYAPIMSPNFTGSVVLPFSTYLNGILFHGGAPRQILVYETTTPGTTRTVTFTKESYSYLKAMRVQCVGGGGGGGGCTGAASGQSEGGGGGGGGYCEKWFDTDAIISLSASITVTIGKGGAGGNPGAGGAGAASSFGSIMSAAAGSGGGTMTSTTGNAATAGASTTNASSGGDINLRSTNGFNGRVLSGQAVLLGSGGVSAGPFGSGTARALSAIGTGTAGRAYGGGGGGAFATTANQAGGKGADGVVIIELYG